MKYIHLIAIFTLLFSCQENRVDEGSSELSHKEYPYQIDSLISKPVKFYPGVVSTAIDKFNTSFSPDGKTIYYTATSNKLGITGIAYQHFRNGQFESPQFVPFVSSDIPIADVQISPDGIQMFFSTFKDYEGKPEGFNFNIWVSELVNNVWQDPQALGEPIASTGNEFYPVPTDNKTIYFNSDRSGNSDLYFAKYVDGKYEEPIRLPDNINSPRREADAFIARDESYLIFVRVDEEDGFGQSDLYISFRTGDNEWTDPKNLGINVNSNQIDGSPYITPDEKYLIFTSGRQEEGIKAKAIENYEAFKKLNASSDNGSLNFYIMSFNSEQYR